MSPRHSIDIGNWAAVVVDLLRPHFSSVDATLTMSVSVTAPTSNRNAQSRTLLVIEFLPYEIIGGKSDGQERDNGFACDLGAIIALFPGAKCNLNYTPNSRMGRGEIVIEGLVCGIDAFVAVRLWSSESKIPEYRYNEETGEEEEIPARDRAEKAKLRKLEMMADDEDDDEDDDEEEDEAPRH